MHYFVLTCMLCLNMLLFVELDPHGADEQGNPLGGMVYSNGFTQNAKGFASQLSSGSNGSSTLTQVGEWIL